MSMSTGTCWSRLDPPAPNAAQASASVFQVRRIPEGREDFDVWQNSDIGMEWKVFVAVVEELDRRTGRYSITAR